LVRAPAAPAAEGPRDIVGNLAGSGFGVPGFTPRALAAASAALVRSLMVFPREFGIQEAHARDIATGSVDAGNETKLDRSPPAMKTIGILAVATSVRLKSLDW
jgi:hypothetical protein